MILKSCFLAALGAFLLQAQPVGDVLTKARAKMDELSAKLAKAKAPDDLRADAGIYLKAGEWMLRHPEEFYKPEYSDQLLAVLDRGSRGRPNSNQDRRPGQSRRAGYHERTGREWMAVCNRMVWSSLTATIQGSQHASTSCSMAGLQP